MVFPVLWQVGGSSLHAHTVLEALAYTVSFWLYRRLPRSGDFLLSLERWAIIAAALVGAAVGSKLLYWAEDPPQTMMHWRDAGFLLGGKTIIGALLRATIAVECLKSWMGVTRRTGDLF